MKKQLIASRANNAIGANTKFYKSYIKNVTVEAQRMVGHVVGWIEQDVSFIHKDKRYLLVQELVPNSDGTKKYSAEYRYYIKEVK